MSAAPAKFENCRVPKRKMYEYNNTGRRRKKFGLGRSVSFEGEFRFGFHHVCVFGFFFYVFFVFVFGFRTLFHRFKLIQGIEHNTFVAYPWLIPPASAA